MDGAIDEIRKKYDLIGVVGTINPNIDHMEYISLEEIINKKGLKRLEILIQENKETNYQSLIDEKLVFNNLNVKSKEELIDILGRELKKNDYVKDHYVKTIWDRENIGTTYFTNFIAIPHGDPKYVKKPVICVASLSNPIKWGDDSVKIVFLLCLKAENMNGIINLQRLCEDEDNIKIILKGNKEEMVKFLEVRL
jgi:mannitol/fructose-specific phosphotransferase system IIA component (Ntr-type)